MERVWKIMKNLRLQPDYSAYVATISAYGRCGMYDKMETRFQELEVCRYSLQNKQSSLSLQSS